MKLSKISSLYTSSFRKALLLVFSFLLVVQLLIAFQLQKQHKEISRKETNSAFMKIQKDISEKLSIVASSQLFVDFISSGNRTQDELRLDMEVLFSSIKEPSILGYEILGKNGQSVFRSGSVNSSVVSLKLCYLDSYLDNEFGLCEFRLNLYFDKDQLAERIVDLNSSFSRCESCEASFISAPQKFGSFSLDRYELINLSLEFSQGTLASLFYVEVFFIFLLILATALLYKSFKKISSEYLILPIEKILNSLTKNENVDTADINITELKHLAEELNSFMLKAKDDEELRKQASLVELAQQVAHDIRSPLSALRTVQQISPGQNSLEDLLNASIDRISEIADNLLLQGRKVEERKYVDVCEMLNNLVTEKRTEYQNSKLQITFSPNLKEEIFGKFNATELRCVISNIINNAVEACSYDKQVSLELTSSPNFFYVRVTDQGKGIPEHLLNQLGTVKISEGKENGNGLGLYNAFRIVKSFGGELVIESKKGQGTSVLVKLPRFSPPEWFISELDLIDKTRIIIVDDDEAIHLMWREKLRSSGIEIVNYRNPNDFIKDFPKFDLSKTTLLVDYCFKGQPLNGFELILQLNLQRSAILVSSKVWDDDVLALCTSQRVKALPKKMIGNLPLLVKA